MNTTTFTSASASQTEIQDPSDDVLMASIQQGDTEALKTFYQRHRRIMRSMVLRTVSDDPTADDVLQDCLLNLWNHARSYSPDKGKPLAWVITLCRRRAIDALRRNMAYYHAIDRMELAIPHAEFDEHAAAENEQQDMAQVLEQHLALLPPPQQEVVRLAFLKGLSQREVAKTTHCPLGTVKTRLELGLKKLRQTLRTRSSIHTLQAA